MKVKFLSKSFLVNLQNIFGTLSLNKCLRYSNFIIRRDYASCCSIVEMNGRDLKKQTVFHLCIKIKFMLHIEILNQNSS